MKLSLTAAALSFAAVNADVLQLTPSNFSEMTAGKTVFIKFFAPCKSFQSSFFMFLGHFLLLSR